MSQQSSNQEHEKNQDEPIVAIDEFLPMTRELTIDQVLKFNIGGLSEELYQELHDFFRDFVDASQTSDVSNFRKFKVHEAADDFREDTDLELRRYAKLFGQIISEIEESIIEAFDEFFTSEDIAGKINVLIVEMVSNAFHHGNKNDPRKNITIDASIVEEEGTKYLEVKITNEGEGFDPKIVDDLEVGLTWGKGIMMTGIYTKQNLRYEDEGRTTIFRLPEEKQEQ